MADAKLTALPQGTFPPDLYYGEQGGISNKYNGPNIINVKDYGAVGNGVADDTAAIQAALDAAFGTYASPHGGLEDTGSAMYTNKGVYFPQANYAVSSAIVDRAFTSAANDGTGQIRLACSTTGLTTGDNINVLVATGNTNAQQSWFIRVDDASHLTLLLSTFVATATGTFSSPCLRVAQVQGGLIFGGGRFTSLRSSSHGAAIFQTDGMGYTRIENLNFAAASRGIGLQLDANPARVSPTVNLQSNTVFNCYVQGGDWGIKIGAGQSMGSEHIILNSYVAGCAVAGVYVGNQNAVQVTMIGGNIASCDVGIWVGGGGMNLIACVSFQTNTTADIRLGNGATEGYTITGCRTESANFVWVEQSWAVTIQGCNQTQASAGNFFKGSGYITIEACQSLNGCLTGNAQINISNCNFIRSDYLTGGADTRFASLNVIPQPLTTQAGTSFQLRGCDSGTRIKFTSGSAIAVTVPKNSDTTTFTIAGSIVELEQYGAGQITVAGASGVTVHSRNGLKTAGQYSIIRLVCDGSDTWTLSGDTAP